jgi:hypothetical protein
MQIVIDVPEQWEKCNIRFIKECIRNGTQLPKGHGRLIAADELDFEEVDFYSPDSCYEVYRIINDAHTIVEADKEVEV